MAKQYAVLHTEKGKGIGGGTGNHIDRTLGMEHTYPHADPKRLHLNIDYSPHAYRHKTVPEAIVERIHKGYNHKRKIRTDAVKYLETVLSGTHEQMKAIQNSKDPKALEKWAQANADFMSKEFGAKNIVRFVLHLDEKTPHIHCVHVPLTEDGRLSARAVLGDKYKMKQRQTRYAQVMKPFGLERGESRRGVYHEKAQEYYRRINITEDIIENIDVKGLFGVNTGKALEKTKEALRGALMQLERAKKEIDRLEKSLKKTETEKRKVEIKKSEVSKKYSEIHKTLVLVTKSPEALEKIRKQVLVAEENIKKRKLKELKNKGTNKGRKR